jgi:hypothetical protein
VWFVGGFFSCWLSARSHRPRRALARRCHRRYPLTPPSRPGSPVHCAEARACRQL